MNPGRAERLVSYGLAMAGIALVSGAVSDYEQIRDGSASFRIYAGFFRLSGPDVALLTLGVAGLMLASSAMAFPLHGERSLAARNRRTIGFGILVVGGFCLANLLLDNYVLNCARCSWVSHSRALTLGFPAAWRLSLVFVPLTPFASSPYFLFSFYWLVAVLLGRALITKDEGPRRALLLSIELGAVILFVFEVGIYLLDPVYRNVHVTTAPVFSSISWLTNDNLFLLSGLTASVLIADHLWTRFLFE